MSKTCTRCHQELPLDSFYKHPQTRDGRQTQCKRCLASTAKENERIRRAEGTFRKPKRKKYGRYFSNLKSNAKARSLEVGITREQYRRWITLPCHYCGVPGENGVDRVDNSRGYLPDNCVPCCTLCNRAKMTNTREEFIAQCIRVADHQRN